MKDEKINNMDVARFLYVSIYVFHIYVSSDVQNKCKEKKIHLRVTFINVISHCEIIFDFLQLNQLQFISICWRMFWRIFTVRITFQRRNNALHGDRLSENPITLIEIKLLNDKYKRSVQNFHPPMKGIIFATRK